jgi:hypothetical protein
MQITRIWQPTDLAGNPNATQVNIEVEDTAVKQVHCAFTSKVAAVPDLMANIEPMKLSVRLPKPRDI